MERPKVGVGVIILRGNKVLMHKRKGAHGIGTWGFPGRHLEFLETPEDCAVRETLEDCGLNVKNPRRAPIFTNDVHDKEGKHYITLYVIAEYDSGEAKIMESEKCERWDWFSWEELPQPLFIPIVNLLKQGYNPFIQKYQHYKGELYEIIGEGKHSEDLQDLVVYRALYNSPEFGKNAIWVRPKKMFHENVIIDGKEVPRFKKT